MYTVLEIKHCEADATIEYDYMEKHMVKLTTPWRFGKWKGRWCEGPRALERVPAHRRAVRHEGEAGAGPTMVYRSYGRRTRTSFGWSGMIFVGACRHATSVEGIREGWIVHVV